MHDDEQRCRLQCANQQEVPIHTDCGQFASDKTAKTVNPTSHLARKSFVYFLNKFVFKFINDIATSAVDGCLIQSADISLWAVP